MGDGGGNAWKPGLAGPISIGGIPCAGAGTVVPSEALRGDNLRRDLHTGSGGLERIAGPKPSILGHDTDESTAACEGGWICHGDDSGGGVDGKGPRRVSRSDGENDGFLIRLGGGNGPDDLACWRGG